MLTLIDYLLAALLIDPIGQWLAKRIGNIAEDCPPDCDECNEHNRGNK